VRQQLLDSALRPPSNRPSTPKVEINRVGKTNAQDDVTHTAFHQVFEQLKDVDVAAFQVDSGTRVWTVKLIGEGATDAGGPYQEILSQICREVQSPPLSMFIPCPNAQIATEQEGSVAGRDKFIPNPSKTSAQHLKMYRFIGLLLGVALRSGHALPLNLPSVVWKPLVGTQPSHADLRAIDHFCCKFLDGLRHAEVDGITEENFASVIFESFTTSLSDGTKVELKPDGAKIQLTYADRLEYASLVERARLQESNAAITAMQDGFYSVVPPPILAFFTWAELEVAVCGKPNILIEELKEMHSRLDGFEKDDPSVLMLWEVLETFTMEERCMFLRFACGRERLPDNTEFKVVIAPLYREVDVLPRASTCGSMFKLPRYTSKEKMRDQILLAVTSCTDIDNDFNVH